VYRHLINNIIPADDLHWDKSENKYVSLSEKETQEIIAGCLDQGMKDLNDVYRVVQWCGCVRVGQILWKNFLQGSLSICGFDENDEPLFTPYKEPTDEN
jgi:hypothetical protein